ncbi:hypothetical protein VTJ49DRAFT_3677 [Mycothermus thermophilus]|uniref:Uncharacterized protein n=1 Tax=Humicola insolens TaxID=85995 RepID=A0ABR3V6Z2_HUMIN
MSRGEKRTKPHLFDDDWFTAPLPLAAETSQPIMLSSIAIVVCCAPNQGRKQAAAPGTMLPYRQLPPLAKGSP